MRITISHEILYAYDKPVFVEPHILRLRPFSNSAQRLINFQCQLEPEPQLLTHIRDANDNDTVAAWFTGKTDSLKITIRSEVETLIDNPFEYILDPNANSLATIYDDDLKRVLSSYLQPLQLWDDQYGHLTKTAAADIDKLESELREESHEVPTDFVGLLNDRLSQRFELIVRPDGEPFPPLVALGMDSVACRDIVLLAMALCRRAGIAARFVSGYSVPDEDAEEHHMHAWLEVYLPGAGWRGLDPTSGLAVANQHVAVAKAGHYADAAPVTGTVRGDDVASNMSATVRVESDESDG